MRNVANAVIEKIFRRKLAYRRTFMDAEGRLTAEAEIILNDLRKFCRAGRAPIQVSPVSRTVDPIGSALIAGRQEAFQRIVEYLFVNEKQVFDLIARDPE